MKYLLLILNILCWSISLAGPSLSINNKRDEFFVYADSGCGGIPGFAILDYQNKVMTVKCWSQWVYTSSHPSWNEWPAVPSQPGFTNDGTWKFNFTHPVKATNALLVPYTDYYYNCSFRTDMSQPFDASSASWPLSTPTQYDLECTRDRIFKHSFDYIYW